MIPRSIFRSWAEQAPARISIAAALLGNRAKISPVLCALASRPARRGRLSEAPYYSLVGWVCCCLLCHGRLLGEIGRTFQVFRCQCQLGFRHRWRRRLLGESQASLGLCSKPQNWVGSRDGAWNRSPNSQNTTPQDARRAQPDKVRALQRAGSKQYERTYREPSSNPKCKEIPKPPGSPETWGRQMFLA